MVKIGTKLEKYKQHPMKFKMLTVRRCSYWPGWQTKHN